MYEQTKSAKRRFHNGNFHSKYFVGDGIDIGGAPDPFSQYIGVFPMVKSMKIWDLADGNAQYLQTSPNSSYDFVVSSHCLEHMVDVEVALENWIRIVKEGGYLIITVPDEDMYEQRNWPSLYNDDHKWTFTIQKKSSWSPKSINILELLQKFSYIIEIEKIEKITEFYNYSIINEDQTKHPNIESSIEFIVKKRVQIVKENLSRIWFDTSKNKLREFSANYSKIFPQIESLKDTKEKFIVYGAGTFGKTLQHLLKEQFVEFIDSNSDLILLNSIDYDKIIISTLGREEEIIAYLVQNNIDEKKILCLTI